MLDLESSVLGASTGHENEKLVFGGVPAVNKCSVFPKSGHILGLKDAQGLERGAQANALFCSAVPGFRGKWFDRHRFENTFKY